MTPKLSILIATKNRIPYCINVIETILKFDDLDFELVVQDNSDTLELKAYVANNIYDKRLIYNYTPPPFSSIDNFNAVIAKATGEYACLIGDDDGINPEIFKVVRWASQNNIDAIVPELNAIYWWPDACNAVENMKRDNGVLNISRITGTVTCYDTGKAIKQLMQNGGQNYLNLNFPKLYHGIVKRELLGRIKIVTGNYVGGLSPDIYIAVALTAFVKRIIKIDYPLTIPGICIASTSGDAAAKRDTGKLEDAPHFRDRGAYSWARQVPKFYSSANIWADSAIASLIDMKRFSILKKFDVMALTVWLLKRHKEYSEIILSCYFENVNASTPVRQEYHLMKLLFVRIKLGSFSLLARIVHRIKKTVNRFIHFEPIKNSDPVRYTNIENIGQATAELSKYLSAQSISIDYVIKGLNDKYCT